VTDASIWSEVVYTIGYSGQTHESLLVAIRGLVRVIDVRSRANSRRPEFRKQALRQALIQAGIQYEHCPAMGADAPPLVMAQAVEAFIRGLRTSVPFERTCLLCLEHYPEDCHRSYLLEPYFRLHDMRLSHLLPLSPRELAEQRLTGDNS